MHAPAPFEHAPRRGEPPAGVTRLVIVLAVTGTILLALGAFWLSFTTLMDLAVLSGIPSGQAWVWPLIVDGVILEATISVVALRNSAPAARRFAWLLLAAGAGVSVAANVTHAVVASDIRVPAVIAAVVASVPPLVLLAMTHLTVELTRNATPPGEPFRVDPSSDGASCTAEIESSPDAEPGPSPEPRGIPTAPPTPAATDRPAEEASAGSPRRGDREQARARALALHAQGVPKRQIAAEEGVHPTTVGRWLNAPERQQDGAHHD